MRVIATIRSPFTQKFGVPRQGNLAPHVRSFVVFEPEFRNKESLRGMEGFSHLWLIWQFHLNGQDGEKSWQATVRPPRLGGNTRVGVFASRSPFRPNGMGLSVVKIEALHLDARDGAMIELSGADLVDGTPIFDIKPYVPYADCIPDARGGFAAPADGHLLKVTYAHDLQIPPRMDGLCLQALHETLQLDPRPAYHDEPDRVYHLIFQPFEVSFCVKGSELTIVQIKDLR